MYDRIELLSWSVNPDSQERKEFTEYIVLRVISVVYVYVQCVCSGESYRGTHVFWPWSLFQSSIPPPLPWFTKSRNRLGSIWSLTMSHPTRAKREKHGDKDTGGSEMGHIRKLFSFLITHTAHPVCRWDELAVIGSPSRSHFHHLPSCIHHCCSSLRSQSSTRRVMSMVRACTMERKPIYIYPSTISEFTRHTQPMRLYAYIFKHAHVGTHVYAPWYALYDNW